MDNTKAAGANTTDKEIGSRIANALIVKGTNVKALSDQTGISYPTLRRSLTGGRSLTIREIGTIAASIGVEPAVLLPTTLTERAAA